MRLIYPQRTIENSSGVVLIAFQRKKNLVSFLNVNNSERKIPTWEECFPGCFIARCLTLSGALDEWSLWQLLEMTDSGESWLPAVKVSIFKAHQFQWECSTGPICYFWQRGKFLTWIWDSYWRSSLAANKMNFNMLPMNKRHVPKCWWNLTPSIINGNFALISFFSLLSFSSTTCSW